MLPVVCFLLAGCTNPYAKWENRSDACYAAREPLVQMGDDFERTVLGATAIGAGGGALAGLVIGRGQSMQDVLLGAAAGALAGALTGYLDAKWQRAKTQGQVLAEIDADASHDTAVVSQSTNTISGLIACRNSQVHAIEAGYANQSLTRAQALEQYRLVQTEMREDDELIRTLLGAADQREQKYIGARAQVLALQQAPAAAASPATQRLSVVRQQAGEQESAYQGLLKGVDQDITRLSGAVG